MKTIGLIAEYNPLHNGHIYHINKIKEMYPNSRLVLVLAGNFTQRGIPSIIDKWTKTDIVLNYGIDLVIELPYPYATESADIFAKGAIEILTELNCDYLIFGSENNNVDKLIKLANIQINNKLFDELVKKNLKKGINYPTAMNLALKEIGNDEVSSPNDILALSYIKEIIKQNSKIIPLSIKRTTNYHDENINSNIASATSIRKLLKNKDYKSIEKVVPKETLEALKTRTLKLDDYFLYFKYQIYTNKSLVNILDVDEGIENKILNIIDEVNNFDEFIEKVKTKRYTHNKIVRMINHILCNYTKEENNYYKNMNYIRVLGFNNEGKNILKEIKNNTNLPIITKYKKHPPLELEKRITSIYSIPLNSDYLTKQEYQNKPIIKNIYK